MALTFAETHNMIAYLTKSDASEGFDQIIDFLNAGAIKYALTVNPKIYVSCIKQFWSSVSVKKVNDVTRLQALIDRKKVIITEATVREALRLDNAESIDCLPNEEIFTELSRMGAKRTSWNEFSSSMASAVICLSTGMIVAQQADDVADQGVASVDVYDVSATDAEPTLPSPTPTTQPPPPSQKLPSTSQVIPTPPSSPIAHPSLPPQQTQPSQPTHDAEISMYLLQTLLETCTTLTRKVEALDQDKVAQAFEIIKLKQRVKKLERKNKLKVYGLRRLKKVGTAQRVKSSRDTVIDDVSKQGEIIANMDAAEDVILKDVDAIAKEVNVEKDVEIEENADVQGRQAESQAQIYEIDLEHADKFLSMQDDELDPVELKEVVTTAKLMTEVVTAAGATITAATTLITAASSAARRRKGVVIRDPEETATPSIIIHTEPKSKDKGKEIMVQEPKPLKKKTQIEQDEAYARDLEAELNKNINWDDVIKQVQRKKKEDNDVLRYQALKRKPHTESQASKNMMIYLRNMVGFKMDYLKGMSYDDIRPIFEKYFNSNVAFLEKTKAQMEEEDNRVLKRTSESLDKKVDKKQKLDEEVEELKKHLQIVPNNDDDVYTKATPLALKVPVVDYAIHTKNNKPYFKIIRADGTHQLFLRFLSLLKNFDKEDLEVLWQIVKERFASSKPNNFLDDFLLTTLTYMFEKPNVEAQV
uniref:Xylulose kinase-1 n=1 Tax=Tanacetum cinerariifolium TaxID=118510 RepID=A0A699ICL6_TANCI|nr:hypothetical protein [Tanacetum cinerariifolium]